MKQLNLRQERFAQLVAQGTAASRAYVGAGYSDNLSDARANACLLLKTPHVAARVAEIRHLAASLAPELLTILEKRRFLADVVRTPVSSIGPDSCLCQGFSEAVKVLHEPPANDDASASTGADPTQPKANANAKAILLRRRIKIADKLQAIALDSKLAGHLNPPDTPPAAPSEDPLKAIAERIRQTSIRMAKESGASLLWFE